MPAEGATDLLAGPIRGELLGAEQLADRARSVARGQRVSLVQAKHRRARSLARLNETRRILHDAHQRLVAGSARDIDVGPAGEWLLDNFHVVQEHIQEVADSLPRGYYRELPELAKGPLTGYPRVYELAISLISHTEGRIDLENVDLFIGAFQEVTALTIGELWAVPAMLRLGLIENVRRVALRTVQRLDEVEAADRWAARLQAANEEGPDALTAALNEFVAAPHALTPTFVSRFLHQLRLATGAAPVLLWLEQWIAEEGVSFDDAATRSTQRMALTQITMANSITSLRAIGRLDWRTVVERESAMEAVLRGDPSGFYSQMTFETRDRYRHVVERIAKRTGQGEEVVARAAIKLAAMGAAEHGSDPQRSHVGYYLVDDGLASLERTTGYRPTLSEASLRWVMRHPNLVFVGGIMLGTVAALAALLWLANPVGPQVWLAVLLFGLIPANDIAVNLFNQLVTAFLPPRRLPRLDLPDHGIPSQYRTAVVIPTLFGSVESVRDALDNLEVQFLANRRGAVHFAVLSDFTDSPTETRKTDGAILATAVAGVQALNARYAEGRQDLFYLFHRQRLWNPQQGVWMGWERKRGKLGQFNRFVQDGKDEGFSTIVGSREPLRQVRYVITLDADTKLPPDAAAALVGTIAHPLNRAVYDATLGRVVRGYGILQPRVGVSLPSAHRSRFAAIQSGHPGVDPYTTAVSDVYQDLYGEGSFTGKGIYEIETFEQATHGRFPENRLLSHDLIEGNYARAGLVTDITVYDDYPTRYLTFTRRKHRWIRGDWQLLQWLTARVPGPDGPEQNRLSLLSRWKLLDNLRRSTVEIAQLLFLVAGWTVLPGSPLRWTLLGLGAIAMPWLAAILLAVLQPPLDKSWRAYYEAVGQDARTSVQQIALAITFLPHQAWVSADAILRTLGRLFVTRRDLLEWQTARQTERVVTGGGLEVWRTMWPTVVVVSLIFLLTVALEMLSNAGILCASCMWSAAPGVSLVRIWQLAVTLSPLCALWAASPAIAQSLSAPAIRRERRLAPALRVRAMRYALLHWRFFDRFVTAESNWLAPDNFQETPVPVTAMRTSPTNAGLQLLAVVSAYELGLITVGDMTRRLEKAFESLARLSRFRGHFFNWYDLRNLQLLEPAYISTVDSGNLAGHLIALSQACLAIRDDPPFDARLWRAIDAALGLANERLRMVAAVEGGSAQENSRALVKISDMLRAVRTQVTTLVARSTSRGLARKPEPGAAKSDNQMEALAAVAHSLHQLQDAIRRVAISPATIEPFSEWIDWSVHLVEEHRSRPANELNPSTTLRAIASSSPAVATLMGRLEALASRAHSWAMEMDFTFLFDETRELFAIGYQTGTHSLDPSYYDLLASEARLASFIAIAKNDAPIEHWFRLGRTLTHAAGETALVSWSGSMFEYLMPVLVMQSFPFTVLNQTYRAAVQRQMAYGAERGVPWGMSESAYNVRDRHLTYQYRAFGVPDLALKRGLNRDLVVAPYASALAIMVEPSKALANLGTLEKKGALGPYGFRDALDYTRPRPGEGYAVVENYMAHHVGMSFVALTNALLAKLWQRRFHADPMVRSAELLLHERVPRRLALQEPIAGPPDEGRVDEESSRPAVREVDSPETPQPRVALLGHLPYTIMISHCGGGYSRYQDLAVTRWRADGTRDHTGQFCYLKDVSRGRLWSASHQPLCIPADWYRAVLATDRVTFHRADGHIETRTEIAVVPEDSAEVRRVTVTNNGNEPREIELTSYGEIVLASPDSDRAHPAFSNLFVETEWHEWCTAITATRRPRSANDPSLWCVHVVDTGKERIGSVTCETDRARFLGRGRSPREPIAVERDGSLSGTVGAVLDPIFALRTRVRVAPGQSASVAFTTLVAATRERAFELAGRYHDPHAAQRAFDLAWTSAQIELRELGITPADAAVFQEIAGHLFYSSSDMRAPQADVRRNRGSQPRLWANGLSGDWPIILATIDSVEGLATLRQVFAAHRYWRRRGMMVDLFILNAHPHTYLQELNDRIMEAMFASGDPGLLDRPGGVFIRPRDLVSAEDLLMIAATARVQIPCDGRSLGRIVDSLAPSEIEELEDGSFGSPTPRLSERSSAAAESMVQRFRSHASNVIAPFTSLPWPNRQAGKPRRVPPSTRTPVSVDNGLGGLAANGDYQIRVRGDRMPPTPWVNVIANARGGFVVSERGTGFTWAENSFFFRLTPWHNDPVTDPASEGLYLQDMESGELWSAAPAPVPTDGEYIIHHGPGSSSFEHDHGQISSTLTLGIAETEAIKLSLLRITNRGPGRRRFSITAYIDWTLGVLREHTQHQVHTEFDAERRAILARNYFDQQFAAQVAFLASSEPLTAYTADRREFLGRNGSARDPAGLRGPPLSGSTGAGIDPCAALQWEIELAPGETREMVVLLGAAGGEAEARRAIETYHDVPRAKAAMARTVAQWSERLSVISVRTPEPTFDVMLNRWTLYQALACRIWARSAVYQSSGAYGFRDQLQDVMALVYAEPALARQHILRTTARQFVEGDVQHWWHPQSGRGVRTRFSDDLVWLPYVVEHYVRVTGDTGILDESVPFLAMRSLEPNEHEVYDLPQVTAGKASVYEHCLRALKKACTTGEHGLPLIGGGDWNDGMNRVGVEGRGESVWLAWFLITTLRGFAECAERRGDTPAAGELRSQASAYATATEAHGWDGAWYRRAFFDDGTPLGSAANDECRIDSIAQSWSVISGAGDPSRQALAMRALEQNLVREDARLIMLLTPPFDHSDHDPGYIKGYLPGVRENGSQYTHAALWAVLATALRGDGNRAFELYQMINPLTHARTPDEVQTYKAEPYVVAAEVYTARGHVGRGGWTWYTGSASWMYRVGVETILGFQKRGDSLSITPHVPTGWSEYTINYRHGRSGYEIVVRNPAAIAAGRVAIVLDGQAIPGAAIPLVDDGKSHRVTVSG